MKWQINSDLIVGLFFLCFGLLVIFVWGPQDTDTGLYERQRGRYVIGDALGPILAAAILSFASLILLTKAIYGSSFGGLTFDNLKHIALLLGIVTTAFALMRWAGPVSVWIAKVIGLGVTDYRSLRDTLPWKYIGFVLGGGFLISALIASVERAIHLRTIVIAFVAALVIAMLYDLPFKNIIIPPNNDV